MSRANRALVVELLFSPDSPFITVEISVPTEFREKLKRKGIWLLGGPCAAYGPGYFTRGHACAAAYGGLALSFSGAGDPFSVFSRGSECDGNFAKRSNAKESGIGAFAAE